MTRLFDKRDIEFLRGVPGYTRRMENQFRLRRCRIFRCYLRTLRAEFLAAQTEFETLRIESPEAYQQAALQLLRCRIRFTCAMIPAYLCMFQYRWELDSADLRPVMQRFENIHHELRRWIPGIA